VRVSRRDVLRIFDGMDRRATGYVDVVSFVEVVFPGSAVDRGSVRDSRDSRDSRYATQPARWGFVNTTR